MSAGRDLTPYAAGLALSWADRFPDRSCVDLDGTLLKVDVSGFTRLSERLARSERTGAEGVNAVIDALWTELIGEVLDRGGDVLQFGGDALAVWFEGERAGLRAAAAAHAMHRAVRTRPAQETPAGRVKLRMSAGAESGSVGLGLVGAEHQELVVLGATATQALRCEVAAGAGQTVVGARLAQQLQQEGAVLDGDVVGRLPRVPLEAAAPLWTGDARRFLDPQVRELEEKAVPLGEHRRAAVAFLHLGGLDALTTADAHRQVAQAADVVEEEAGRHDVCWLATDLAADGVVFLLVSGAPRTSENDEERLVRAVRATVDAVPALRAGAHAGRAFAGDVGHPRRRTFAVLGDTTNTAARLMGSASPGQLRVSADLYDASAKDHAVQWLGSLRLKGRRQGVLTGALGARIVRRVPETHDFPLLGRDEEYASLEGLLTGHGACLLTGPAGVGKSRMASALQRRAVAAGLTTLVLRAEPYESATPFGASRDALRELLGAQDADEVRTLCGDEADLAPLLSLPLGVPVPPTEASLAIDPEFVAEARVRLLAKVIRDRGRPLVIAEDLHIADRATLDLVAELARHTAVLGTARDLPADWPQDPSLWDHRELAPLATAAARQLLLAVTGDVALDDLQIERLLGAAGGNPLFLRELVLLATEGDDSQVPEGIEQVIAARIDRLPPAQRALLRQAAVLGATVDPQLLADVLEEPALADPVAWQPLEAFLAPEDGGLRFRHDLYRRVAYQALPVRHRRHLHRVTARVLTAAGTSDDSTLAQHLYAAQQWVAAFECARRAAAQARDAGALGDALALTTTSLDAGRRAGADPRELGDLEAELGDVADLLGRYAVADAAYRRACRTGLPAVRLERLVKRAAVVERQGRYGFALSLLTRVERSAPEPAVLRAALLRRSSTLFRCGRLRESRRAAQQVVALAADSPLDRARGLLRLEMVASELGDPARFELGAEALRAFEGLDEPRELGNLHVNLGVTMWQADDWVAAVRHYEESDAAYQRAGDRVGSAFARNNAAEILVDQGHLERARAGFEEARRVFRAAGHALGAAATDSALGRVYARSGETPRARVLLRAAEADLARMGSSVLAADARVRLVEVALLERRRDAVAQARACLGEAGVTAQRYLGIAHGQGGERDEAERQLRDALVRARETRTLYEVGCCLDCLSRLDRATEEERAELATVWDRLGVVWVPDYGLGQSSSRT